MEDFKEDRPFSHKILDEDPRSRKSLSVYGKILLLVTALVTLEIWGILGLYWGAEWKPGNGVHNMNGAIVDFDGGLIGATVTQAYLNNTGKKTQIDWYTVPASNFPNGEFDIEHAIVNEKYWAIIAIRSSASDSLNAALTARDASGYSNQVVTAYAAEARNENAYRNFLEPQLQKPMTEAMAVFGMEQTMRLGANAEMVLAAAPALILQPVNYTINNVRPFDVEVATAVDFIGLIYLLILAFIVVLGAYQARTGPSGLDRRLTLPQLLILRFSVPFILYFWLSLAYSLLSLFFYIPFDRCFGHAGFVIFWMLSWMGMLALGLAIETMVTILSGRFIPFFLVPWIITNVAVVFYPIEILPTFFRYGYAMPFYNVSRTVRTIVFRTRNEVRLNFGVLFAWIGVSTVTLTLAQIWARRKQVKEWERDMEKREAMSEETARDETQA